MIPRHIMDTMASGSVDRKQSLFNTLSMLAEGYTDLDDVRRSFPDYDFEIIDPNAIDIEYDVDCVTKVTYRNVIDSSGRGDRFHVTFKVTPDFTVYI